MRLESLLGLLLLSSPGCVRRLSVVTVLERKGEGGEMPVLGRAAEPNGQARPGEAGGSAVSVLSYPRLSASREASRVAAWWRPQRLGWWNGGGTMGSECVLKGPQARTTTKTLATKADVPVEASRGLGVIAVSRKPREQPLTLADQSDTRSRLSIIACATCSKEASSDENSNKLPVCWW